MFQRPGVMLILASIFLFVVGWATSFQFTYAQTSTATPSPTGTVTPTQIPLGVNFWDDAMVDDRTLFSANGPGYVLLMYETANNNSGELQTILDANLTPVIRYNNPGKSVSQSWIDDLILFIDTHPEVNLFIIGNEPNHPLEGSFTPVEYATAYARLWRDVHITHGISINDARLLVAGAATHLPNTDTWLPDVSNGIANRSAQVDGYAIHAYGFGLEYDPSDWGRPIVNGTPVPNIAADLRGPGDINIVNCPTPWAANQSCRNIGATWPEQEHGFLVYQQQIESIPTLFADRPVFITEFNTFAWGDGAGNLSYPHQNPQGFVISPYVPANNYPIGWIPQAVQSVNTYSNQPQNRRIAGMIWFVGANSPNSSEWRSFALTEDIGRLDCARADFRSVTRNEPLAECDPQASVPTLNPYLYCEIETNEPAIAYTYSGNGTILSYIDIEASPVRSLPLWNRDPNITYREVLRNLTPNSYITLTLFNQAGLSIQWQTYIPQNACSGGSSSGPGNDHPDDNQSAANFLLHGGNVFTLPTGTRSTPRVAILNRGFTGNLFEALLQLGEQAHALEANFDPTATAEQYPVLFIPSGGLYGLENSTVFRRRLEAYAEAGGTIVAFAQQHGYEFSALPGAVASTPADINLTGYGWQEDNSCYAASLLLATNHPSLSGFSQVALTAHVDGYFSTVPTNTVTLLTRTQNGAPGTILWSRFTTGWVTG